jgi:hypothetical protein
VALDQYWVQAFSDGEGIMAPDLIDLSRRPRAHLTDAFVQALAGSLDDEGAMLGAFDPEFGGQSVLGNASARRAYALSSGAAFLRQGSANNKIAIAPGTLLQKLLATNGADSTLAPFTFDGTTEFTLTNGDGVNPRVDLLQMKLEHVTDTPTGRDFEDAVTRAVTSQTLLKRYRVQCTLSTKAGTPSATPTVPTPDAGFVPIGAAIVGNGWTVSGNAPVFGADTTPASNVVVMDYRMPLRVRAHRVDPVNFKLVTAWALSNNNTTVTSSNATNDLYVACPAGLGRVVAVSVQHSAVFVGGTPGVLGCSTGPIVTTSWFARNNLTLNQAMPDDVAHCMAFDQTTASLGALVVGSGAPWHLGVPLWTNGQRAPGERQRLRQTAVPAPIAVGDQLVLRIQSGVTAHVLGAVTFYVAEGL